MFIKTMIDTLSELEFLNCQIVCCQMEILFLIFSVSWLFLGLIETDNFQGEENFICVK